jgi:hypothetical protein
MHNRNLYNTVVKEECDLPNKIEGENTPTRIASSNLQPS